MVSLMRRSCLSHSGYLDGEVAHAFDAVVELELDNVLESDEVAEVFDFTFWWQDVDVHPLSCYRVVFFWV